MEAAEYHHELEAPGFGMDSCESESWGLMNTMNKLVNPQGGAYINGYLTSICNIVKPGCAKFRFPVARHLTRSMIPRV